MNLIEIYKDTLNYSKKMLDSETTKHTFDEIINPELSENKPKISVIPVDTVSALSEFCQIGKTAVLNMASHKRAGGGVENGRKAQEECLFRCSNLGHVISQEFYPLYSNECLYTKDVVFFKDKNYNHMDHAIVDVITIAAINLSNGRMPDDYEETTKDKMRLMFSLAINNNIENIILGASTTLT